MARRVRSQSRDTKRTHRIKNMQDIQIPLIREESADDPPKVAVVKRDDAGSGVEAFAFLQSMRLNAVPEGYQRRESVRELHEADGSRDSSEAEEIWN